MKRIWKVSVPVDDRTHVSELPAGALACFVACQVALDQVEVWWEVDDEQPTVPRALRVYGTGHAIDRPAIYCGSALAAGGQLVWHVFEVHEAHDNHGTDAS